MRVTVIGTGYVGLVTGACLAYLGHRVTCVDSDGAKIEALSSGRVPIYEPDLEEFLVLAGRLGGIDFTADTTQPVRESDVIFIAVGTPPSPTGSPDLRFLELAARNIGRAMDAGKYRVVVNKSTVPVGSGNLVEMLIREGSIESGGSTPRFGVVSNPEFLQEGSAIANSLYPDRIVVGAEQAEALARMEELYRPITRQSFEAPAFLPRPAGLTAVPFLTTSLTSAEMIKYAANSFLAMKISFANEMANICERVGTEITQVMEGIGLDGRIGGRFLSAGVGWGGSCFGKDLQALTATALEYGYRPLLLEATQEVNRSQRHIVIQKLQEKLYVLKGRTIGLLGLAFKPRTDDLRDAPSLSIASRLLQMGARVKAYDPIAMGACRQQHPSLKLQYCASPADVAAGADALVLVTEWDEFCSLDLSELADRMARAIFIDGRNLLDPAAVRQAGFDYVGIGSVVRYREDLTPALRATA
ncbi:MAG TPA: UDP-glucose/GDP-mannose dehydrogenase family protein [Bryobacteraceae bacterium]|nr:UDP-glucose/GDP-mannose dehydrogenase family protein [Bryobacteraceae bacterium]